MPPRIALLFEDDKMDALKIKNALQGEMKGLKVEIFSPPSKPVKGVHEDVLVRELAKKKDSIAILITDRDLSATPNLGGLSESAVSKLAEIWALPICMYARNQEALIKQQMRWGEGRISVDFSSGLVPMAKQVGRIANGFEEIRKIVVALPKSKMDRSPGHLLARILKRPELADKLSLYGAGDQQMLAEILPYFKKNGDAELRKRLPRVLGNWLWESILRFPGILLNQTATASYLNINLDDFSHARTQKSFAAALYQGPFSSPEKPFWWRSDLDSIVDSKKVESGFEIAKAINPAVRECFCSIDPQEHAGYFCILTEKPVSAKRSKGNLSWLPSGADLARISDKMFDELAPWLALY